MDVATGQKTQLTFGTHDDASAQFLDDDTLVFPSTATDPAQPIDPDVARNGKIYNVWTLNLKNGELRQYTDAVSGNLYTTVLNGRHSESARSAFVTYYKGEYELHALDRRDPIVTAASSDFGAPGPIIDFQAPLSHTLVADNKAKKGKFEKMFMDGRPPVNVGVTSSGDIFGGTAVTFSDVLGDQQFSLYRGVDLAVPHAVVLVSQPRAPLQLRAAGLLADAVLLRQPRRRLLRSVVLGLHRSRSVDCDAHHPRRHGLRHLAVQPLPQRRTVRQLPAVQRELQRSRPAGVFGAVSGRSVRSPAAQFGHAHPARRDLRPGDDRLPRVRSAVRQHGARWRTRSRRRSAARSRDRRPTSTRATTSASARRACWRCAPAGSRAGATRPTSCISAATPRCAATNTCSSSATRQPSSTRSSASR